MYVTGNSRGPGWGEYDTDFATVMYNSSGVQQWVARYDGPAKGYDYASALALDGSGNVYVTGSNGGPWGKSEYDDFATVMYDSSGVQQWVARYNGTGDDRDVAYAIALDGAGDIAFVAGFFEDAHLFDPHAHQPNRIGGAVPPSTAFQEGTERGHASAHTAEFKEVSAR